MSAAMTAKCWRYLMIRVFIKDYFWVGIKRGWRISAKRLGAQHHAVECWADTDFIKHFAGVDIQAYRVDFLLVDDLFQFARRVFQEQRPEAGGIINAVDGQYVGILVSLPPDTAPDNHAGLRFRETELGGSRIGIAIGAGNLAVEGRVDGFLMPLNQEPKAPIGAFEFKFQIRLINKDAEPDFLAILQKLMG